LRSSLQTGKDDAERPSGSAGNSLWRGKVRLSTDSASRPPRRQSIAGPGERKHNNGPILQRPTALLRDSCRWRRNAPPNGVHVPTWDSKAAIMSGRRPVERTGGAAMPMNCPECWITFPPRTSGKCALRAAANLSITRGNIWRANSPDTAPATRIIYVASVPANRPVSEYTPRIVPCHPLASVPLECARILRYR